MIALHHDGAGLSFVAVERAARDTGDGAVGDHLHAVEDDRDVPSDQCDFVRLPLTRRGNRTINASNADIIVDLSLLFL